jgi:hypothetical protein
MARKGCSVWPAYKYRYLSLSLSLSLSPVQPPPVRPRVCHRVLRRSSLHRIPRVSRICPLQANHLRPRCRRAEATLGRSVQAYRIPPISNLPLALLSLTVRGSKYIHTVQIRARLNRQGAYLAVLVHASTTTLTGMSRSRSRSMSIHVVPSHISAGRLERKSATIPASAFRHLQISLHCFSS